MGEKPIYRKIIICSDIDIIQESDNIDINIDINIGTIVSNITDIDTIIRYDCVARMIGGYDIPVPYHQFDFLNNAPDKAPNQLATWWRDRNKGDIYIRTQVKLDYLHLILEYTKL